ncbi:MAG TPA: LysE family transporter [Hypericibacter adhaerens]|uniref:LysE family translocator n=1 Tax=Hypericibacter adhaerens TaxID=2602016 RepID=UPI002C2F7D6A|nr:LysE family transporter [Hypericibacter adhaerens]HWA45323.1 LysE family transporter [Hypericibacter adhaerens]
MTDPVQFALAVLLLLSVPGPTNTVMATAGAVNRGEWPWPFMLGELAGYFAIVLLARLVLLPLIDAVPWLGVALKCLVVLYLVYAAIRLWRTRLGNAGATGRVSVRLVFFTTFLNPKGLIFAIAIIPREHPALWGYFAAFAALVLAIGCCWFMAGRTLGVLAGRRAGVLPRLGSLALLGFAGYLVASLVSA